jgi:hypothetical protein
MKEWLARRVCLRWLVLGVSALMAVVLAAQLAPTTGRSASAACQGSFTIDFAGFPAGTVAGEQYADRGVHISAKANGGFPDAIVVFDSNAPPTHDPDLAVNIGNILVLANNVQDANNDGLVDDPDENNFGGTQTFQFDQPVHIGSFKFIDKDHDAPAAATAFGAAGNVVGSAPILNMGNASVQTVTLNADNVRRLEIVYPDSGALTGIEVTCQAVAGATADPTTDPGSGSPTNAPSTAGQQQSGEAAGPTPQTAVAAAVARPQPQALPETGGAPNGSGSALPYVALSLLAVAFTVAGGTVLAVVRRRV